MKSEKRIQIKSQKILFNDYLVIEEAFLTIEKFNGTMSREIRRLSLNRSDASCILLFDEQANSILLVNQFRYPSYRKGIGFMWEIPAGIVEKEEDPKETIIREAWEETGYEINKPKLINVFYPSSGVSSERCFFYYSEVNRSQKKGEGGGLDSENEDLEAQWFELDQIKTKLFSGEITDAKTIIAIQWFLLTRNLDKI